MGNRPSRFHFAEANQSGRNFHCHQVSIACERNPSKMRADLALETMSNLVSFSIVKGVRQGGGNDDSPSVRSERNTRGFAGHVQNGFPGLCIPDLRLSRVPTSGGKPLGVGAERD